MAETPLDPRYKGSGFFLNQTVIPGRKRARGKSIPEGHLDFLALNGDGELIAAPHPVIVDLLTEIRDQLKSLNEAMLALQS